MGKGWIIVISAAALAIIIGAYFTLDPKKQVKMKNKTRKRGIKK